ncbi:MAG TPA: NAD-dependent dehydratase [Leeuwenhoekiella sp.]|uniref:SDR family oxidoreductase n=1 Tax=Leeuwenhoekiella TaxID=283735 RepID=UPI000C6B1363|nr:MULTISPECIES: SDR family oxidoreductase [Leeuwenhoekiella]MBH13542.1 NAD-dependent dehydratase [Leeuwenhoekiella sp.]UBZ09598.1 SDR family oxidoreductase [Leeuwenhoekiella palythoae]HBO29815.1 NAD-dependent dehydratase [Leeuwenhoekiella sp.]HCQ76669.1 NAD-dependent dehydratase [Leeuwenhoekiella sp.]|tara:strand:- start:230 stop:877 length:648 start_codon:yes stop_codon:yes gene_type:complete
METSKENVLVAGANGTTGKLIVSYLDQSQYYNPVAMVRKQEQQKQFKIQGIDTVLGDLEKDLSKAVKGIDKVIFAAGSGGNTGPEKTIDVDQEGAKRLIDASKDVEVKKFIMLSSINADNPESSESLRHYLEAKRKADNYLKNSGLNYTIVRPGTLKNEEGTRKIEAALDVEHGEVTRDDVAYTLVHVLNDDVAQNAVFEMVEGEQRIEDAIKEF